MSYTKVTPFIASGFMTAAAAMFACSDDAGPQLGSGGSGTGGDTTSSSQMQSSSSPAVTTTAGSTSSGMSTFDCDPPAEPGSIYELEDVGVFPPNDPYSMCQFRGEVLLVFNAAAI